MFEKQSPVKTISLSLFTLLFCVTVSAQHFSAEETKADLSTLKKSILENNPGIALFSPKYGGQADSLIATVKTEQDIPSYFTLVAKLCALSNEGHMGVGSWQDTAHAGFASNTILYLPLQVKIIDDRMFVWADYSDEHALEKGDEIIAFNGQKTASVL